jgi:hypothetical protein
VEYDHPYYGADGYTIECASFTELREYIDSSDEDLNRVYRWDWVDHTQPYADDLFCDGEDRSTQTFTVYAVMPRRDCCVSWTSDQPRPGSRGPRLVARPAGAQRASDAVGAAPRRHGGSAATCAEPYAAVLPRRRSVVGDVAAYHEVVDWPLQVTMATNQPAEAADVG